MHPVSPRFAVAAAAAVTVTVGSTACASADPYEEPGAVGSTAPVPGVSPRLIRCPGFPYPARARITDDVYPVRLRFIVREDGRVDETSFTRLVGDVQVPRWAYREAEALAAGCQFHPARQKGIPVASYYERSFEIPAPPQPSASSASLGISPPAMDRMVS